MSSDDEDGRIAFNTDRDYEEGQWIDGEFYARRQRHGRTLTKEEQLYGYDSEDDDDDVGGRKGKGRKRESTVLRPIDFVTGKRRDAAGKRGKRKRKGGDDEDELEEGDWGRPRGLGAGGDSTDEDDEGEEGEMPSIKKEMGDGDRMEVVKEEEGEDAEAEGKGPLKPGESQSKFKDLLRAGGVGSGLSSSAAAAAGKSQDFFRGMLQEQEEKEKAEAAKLERKKALPVRQDGKSLQWEQHTKGFASRYLAKFGFKGRLGKEETGITKVPEVVVRPERLGLGLMKEMTALRGNREIEADLHGKELEQEEEATGRRKKKEVSVAEEMAGLGNWRKGQKAQKGKKGKGAKLTVKDVLAMEHNADFVHEGEKKQVIVDMRGPTAKLLTRLDEINYEVEAGPLDGLEPPKLGQQLLHNVNLIVDLTESELYSLDRKIKSDKARVETLHDQVHDLEVRVEEGRDKVQRMGKVAALISRVHEKIEEAKGDVPVDAVLKVFRTLKDHFWDEYVMFELWQLAPTMLSSVLTRYMAQWEPLKDPHKVVDIFARWKPVLAGGREGADGRDLNPLLAKAGEVTFQSMLQKFVLPKIRSTLVNQWNVRDAGPAVELMEGLRPLLPPDDFEGLCTTVVLPKLQQGVVSWNPREDVVPIHAWTHRWLPVLGSDLAVVFPEIRRKLTRVLVEWHASDASAHVILEPWCGVFDARSMEQLLLSSIVPKLVHALRDMVISPHGQDLQPLEWVFRWADMLPALHLHAMIEGELFPKWLGTLYAWLASPTADLGEIADWFEGWKGLFPPSVATDPRITAYFDHALHAMNHAMTMAPGTPPLPSPPGLDQVSYLSVLEQRRAALVAAPAPPPPPPPTQTTAGAGVSVSFKDLVEIFAEKNGVLLVPKIGRMHNGRQVYSFGGTSIHLDSDVVFADMGGGRTGGAAKWTPVGLDALLTHVQSKGS